jgi:NDP-sugar pyrophosphorylase family protein
MPLNIAGIPVFILCGGLGTRLKEMTEFRPKPMVAIGPDPILLHIMKHYSGFGFRRFVRSFDQYLSSEDCVPEREPLSKLARDGQLAVFQHRRFWACMDTQRDHEYLTGLCESGNAPWA